jgi:hypothetical protein
VAAECDHCTQRQNSECWKENECHGLRQRRERSTSDAKDILGNAQLVNGVILLYEQLKILTRLALRQERE